MAKATSDGDVHIGHNIEALQRQLGIDDDQMQATLGLSYGRFWDMRRREWAQKKTVEQVAAALTELSGVPVTPENVIIGRLAPEQFASRAVEEFIRKATALDHENGVPLGGIRLPRLHLGSVPAGPGENFETGDSTQVIRADPGDFVVRAQGDCMLPTLSDGDELVCVRSETAGDGELVLVNYADELGEWQVGIKRVRREGDLMWLTCDNKSADSFGRRMYPDIHPTELRIQAQVVGLWRPLRK